MRNIFTGANVRTWRISSGGTVLTHSEYEGKVRLYKGGYLIVSAKNSDYEARTLGAFINEYLSNSFFGVSVAFETALGYYKEERDRLEPNFFEFSKKDNPKKVLFYPSEPLIRTAIKNVKETRASKELKEKEVSQNE